MTSPARQHDAASDAWSLNPEFFSAGAISTDTHRVNAAVQAVTSGLPPRTEMTLEQERSLPPGGGAIPLRSSSTRAYMLDVPRREGPPLPVRVIAPRQAATGVYLHFHGGGFAFGSASNQDSMLEGVADGAGVTCVSVDYRLAPEHPFPAAVEDGRTALHWLLDGPDDISGGDRLVIGGESAGAHLAAVAALWLRDQGRHAGLCGLNLCQGVYDLRLTPGARNSGRTTPVIDTPTIRQQLNRYLGRTDRDRFDVSPFLAPLHDMPPALFTVGTQDPLLEDSLLMYARWVAAGSPAELALAPGGIHGFTFMDCDIGRAAARRIEAFVLHCVRRPRDSPV